MKPLILLFIALYSYPVFAQNTFYGDLLLRYENEHDHFNIADRERIRIIAHGGLKTQWSDFWSTNLRLSTGLKNKQNVPAITVHRFSDQPQPDRDIFIERAYIQGKSSKLFFQAGKVPWKSQQITDIFWDRDISPWGLNAEYALFTNHKLFFSYYQPLDGNSDTIGDMYIIQLQSKFKAGKWTFGFSPWFVDYQGESNAEFATKDTQFDNRFIRLATYAKYGKFRLGLDYGHSLEDFDSIGNGEFSNQKDSYGLEFRHGGLKKVDDILYQFRILRVERFSVITEFAQNAVSRFATNNFKGWDLRIRKKVHDDWWLGVRLSDIERIVAPLEQGIRFRIEAKYSF